MKITYGVKVEGFKNLSHKEAFYEHWLRDGREELIRKAKEIIKNGKGSPVESQPSHGDKRTLTPDWKHVGCLGKWRKGDVYDADEHCLEIFNDPDGRYYLVDQQEHGNYAGHRYSQQVITEITI